MENLAISNFPMAKIQSLTKEQFLYTTEPFDILDSYNGTDFNRKRLLNIISAKAREYNINNFEVMYKLYWKDVKQEVWIVGEYTNFDNQPLCLACSGWIADEDGIRRFNKDNAPIFACYHPIMPVRRLINIDDKIYKTEIAYRPGKVWKRTIEDRSTLADNRAMISLSKHGIAVTSENAKNLVKFIADLEQQNYDTIPETPSVGRLGWIDDYGFSPYMENIVFDGLEDYRNRFESIRPKGSRDIWMDSVKQARKGKSNGNIMFRIVLAASFASVLVKPTRCQPFFVHLWGGSETGKTLAALVAASVWADPELGKYVQSFNSTEVSKELGAAFYNSMPLILDEFQIVDNGKQKDFDSLIYQLSEGMGRGRGKKTGGVQKTTTWANCIISTGENPIITSASKTGAMNRTIEICCEDAHLFDDPRSMNIIYDNFGFAGHEFVDKLMENGGKEKALSVWEQARAEIKTDDTMDKQTNSAALILAADRLTEEWIFQDGILLEPDDITPFMVSKQMMSQNQRCLDWLRDTITINESKFKPFLPNNGDNYNGEVWGKIDPDVPERFDCGCWAYIAKPKFDKLLADNGFNPSSFLGWATRAGEVERDKAGKMTVVARVSETTGRYVKLRLPPEVQESVESSDDGVTNSDEDGTGLPF